MLRVCASTTDVRAAKTEVNLRFSTFGCNPFARNDVRSAKTEVKLRFSTFDCVIVFLCELVYVCVCITVCVCLYNVCASTTEVKISSSVV